MEWTRLLEKRIIMIRMEDHSGFARLLRVGKRPQISRPLDLAFRGVGGLQPRCMQLDNRSGQGGQN